MLALLLTGAFTFAQSMVTAIQMEYTVAGTQYGSSFIYESKKQWGLGVFYQVGVTQSVEIFDKDQFYGAQIQFPLVKSERISFFTSLRGGLVNDKFLVVVPGLETRINVGKRLGVAFGMSLRMNYPSVSSKLICKLF